MEVEVEGSGEKKGASLVLKEISVILEYFQVWIQKSNENVRNITKVGIKLDILATLAPYVSSEEIALRLFKQLLTLSSSLKKPESVLKVLIISKLLVQKVPSAEVRSLVTDLVPLYGRVATRGERLELSLILQNCAELDKEMALVAEICSDLNSYDTVCCLCIIQLIQHLTEIFFNIRGGLRNQTLSGG